MNQQVLVVLAAVMLLAGPDWRWQVLALVLGETALFGLLTPLWALVPRVAWLFASWMAAVILGVGAMSTPRPARRRLLPLWGARLGALAVVAVGARSGAAMAAPWFGDQAQPFVLAALFWSLTGLFQTALSDRVASLTAGELATLAGGTALFGLIEPSRLLLAALLGLQLGVALLGDYLLQRAGEVPQ